MKCMSLTGRNDSRIRGVVHLFMIMVGLTRYVWCSSVSMDDNRNVWASQGKEVGSVRLLSSVALLYLCWNSTQKRQSQDVYLCFLHQDMTTSSESSVVGHI